MFCQRCGGQLQSGLSYCNRCGANLKEPRPVSGAMVAALLSAITVIALGGLGIMFGGAVVLTQEALLRADAVAFFMLMTFLVIAIVEVFLCRQLSKISWSSEQQKLYPANMSGEISPGQTPLLNQPLQSVTENTTRTLDYVRSDTKR